MVESMLDFKDNINTREDLLNSFYDMTSDPDLIKEFAVNIEIAKQKIKNPVDPTDIDIWKAAKLVAHRISVKLLADELGLGSKFVNDPMLKGYGQALSNSCYELLKVALVGPDSSVPEFADGINDLILITTGSVFDYLKQDPEFQKFCDGEIDTVEFEWNR